MKQIKGLKEKLFTIISLWRPIFYGKCSEAEKWSYVKEILKEIPQPKEVKSKEEIMDDFKRADIYREMDCGYSGDGNEDPLTHTVLSESKVRDFLSQALDQYGKTEELIRKIETELRLWRPIFYLDKVTKNDMKVLDDILQALRK